MKHRNSETIFPDAPARSAVAAPNAMQRSNEEMFIVPKVAEIAITNPLTSHHAPKKAPEKIPHA
jgi:hypothetical protein